MTSPPADADADAHQPRVTIVTVVVSAATAALADELRREVVHARIAAVDVLREAPSPAVYVLCLDAAQAAALADRASAWADRASPRAGLIGVIEDGGGADRERLLAAGFDDAVAGRVGGRELAARVRAVQRRLAWTGTGHGRLRFGTCTLDLDGHALWVDGRTVPLTSIELAVLRELIRARGRPLSRGELLDAAWGDAELEISERAVDNVILRLRRKLPRPELLETVRSVGFRLRGEPG